MKIILNILIVVGKMCVSESSVYDWHIRTIERNSDFGDDLKMQTLLNNERQQDILQTSGKINNMEYYPYSYNSPIDKNTNADIKEKNQSLLKDKNDIKYEEKTNDQSIFYQNNNYNSKQGPKKDSKSNYGNDIGYDYNADYQDNYRTNQNYMVHDHQWPLHNGDHEDVLKNLHLNDQNEYKYSNHDYSDVSDNTTIGQDKDNKQKSINRHIDINAETEETRSENCEMNDKQSLNKHKNNSNEYEESPLVNNYSEKYLRMESFVGTNLFDSTVKRCFSNDDVALLTIRKDFENLIPRDLPQCLFDDHMISLLLNYFYICHQIVTRTTSISSRNLAQKAFYDTLGGYLNFYMVPVTKYSYYAGQISLNTAQEILILHQETRKFLNTNGNGWKAPLQNVLLELKSVHIQPLYIPDLSNEPSFCLHLYMNNDENQPDDDKMLVQLPKLEAENLRGFLGNIWLPFRHKTTFDLKSESSAYIVVKFYETVTKCYRFENIDQEFYNEQFKKWLLEIINIHLSDDEFYPGLGAVLRIYEYLKMPKKEFIGIGGDLREIKNKHGGFSKNINHQIRSMHLQNRRNKHNETKEKHNDLKEDIHNVLKESDLNNIHLTKGIVGEPAKEVSENNEGFFNKATLSTFDFTLPRIAIITIPAVAIVLVVIICCCKYCCKKKKSEIQVKPKKNSSSSSSILFNSPVRFFHIRKKSASGTTTMDYSSNEAGNKRSKKSVKIEKKPLINSDSSISSSPIRKKKSKESTVNKDRGKSKDSVKSNV